jgi:hypothetical protein
MLERLQVEDFEPLRGQKFLVHAEPLPVAVELVEVTGARRDARRPAHLRTPFSLVFRGPPTPQLTQKMYDFEHERFGRLSIFIVPIRGDAQAMYYEAVFG